MNQQECHFAPNSVYEVIIRSWCSSIIIPWWNIFVSLSSIMHCIRRVNTLEIAVKCYCFHKWILSCYTLESAIPCWHPQNWPGKGKESNDIIPSSMIQLTGAEAFSFQDLSKAIKNKTFWSWFIHRVIIIRGLKHFDTNGFHGELESSLKIKYPIGMSYSIH